MKQLSIILLILISPNSFAQISYSLAPFYSHQATSLALQEQTIYTSKGRVFSKYFHGINTDHKGPETFTVYNPYHEFNLQIKGSSYENCVDVLSIGENLWMVYRGFLDNENPGVFARKLDTLNGEPGIPIVLQETQREDKENVYGVPIEYKQSENGEYLLVINFYSKWYGNKSESGRLFMQLSLWNKDMKKVWSFVKEADPTCAFVDYNFTLNNNGSVYYAKKDMTKGKFGYDLFNVNSSGLENKISAIELGDYTIQSCFAREIKGNRLLVYGVCFNLSGGGVFSRVLDLKSGQTIIKNEVTQSFTFKDSKAYKNIIPNKFIETETGEFVLLFENNFVQYHVTSSGANQSYAYAGDIICSILTEDGVLKHQQTIHKSQLSNSLTMQRTKLSFVALYKDKMIYLIFNDHKTNFSQNSKESVVFNGPFRDKDAQLVVVKISLDGEVKKEVFLLGEEVGYICPGSSISFSNSSFPIVYTKTDGKLYRSVFTLK